MKNLFYSLLALCLLGTFVGCGDKAIKTEGVTGTISIDGEPTADVNVYFIPVDSNGSSGYAKTDENGVYQLQTLAGAGNAGTTPGKYLVKFDYRIAVQNGTMIENGEEKPTFDSVRAIADKWCDEKTSGVEVEVVPGANTFDFDLTSK